MNPPPPITLPVPSARLQTFAPGYTAALIAAHPSHGPLAALVRPDGTVVQTVNLCDLDAVIERAAEIAGDPRQITRKGWADPGDYSGGAP